MYYLYYSAVDKIRTEHIKHWNAATFFEFIKTRCCCMYQLNKVLIFAEKFSEEHIFWLAADSRIVMKWKYWDPAQSRQDGAAAQSSHCCLANIITRIETHFRENIKELTKM